MPSRRGKRSSKLTDTPFLCLFKNAHTIPAALIRDHVLSGAANLGSAASAAVRAACFPGCFNLLPSSHVGLRKSDVLFCAGNLALMALCESFVHTSHYNRTTVRLMSRYGSCGRDCKIGI